MKEEKPAKQIRKRVRDRRVEVADGAIEQLLEQYGLTPEGIFGKEGLVSALTRRVVEKALEGELSYHLGYAKGETPEESGGNHRNGSTSKGLSTESGPMEIEVPRDREGSFEPVLVRKRQRRLSGLDEKILGLYARGMTMGEIQGFLEEQDGTEVSRELISVVTESVLGEVREWQSRPLERVYPMVILDALWVKMKEEGVVRTQAVYLALATRVDGTREILGIWVAASEGAKFWMKIMNELKQRGVEDLLIAIVDGLKGFPRRSERSTRGPTCRPKRAAQQPTNETGLPHTQFVGYFPKARTARGSGVAGLLFCYRSIGFGSRSTLFSCRSRHFSPRGIAFASVTVPLASLNARIAPPTIPLPHDGHFCLADGPFYLSGGPFCLGAYHRQLGGAPPQAREGLKTLEIGASAPPSNDTPRLVFIPMRSGSPP
jgi:hypothetical protein